MAKEEMIPILRAVGVTAWRDAGWKGQGVKVWNIEDNSGHGACSGQMVLDVAPKADLIFGRFSYATSGDKFTSPPRMADGTDVKVFASASSVQIITASEKGGNRCQEWVDYCKGLLPIPIFNAAANEGLGDGDTVSTRFPIECCIAMGALEYDGARFTRAGYSSVGGDLDFSQSVGWWSGTSAATPFMAGMMAIVMSRYGFMSNVECYKYLQMISRDLGDAGPDTYYGWGQPILPPVKNKYITMTVGDKNFRCDGKPMVMDTVPVNKEGNVFVPIRAISESLGYEVTWNAPVISISNGVIDVTMTIGSDVMMASGKKVYLNFAPYIDLNSRTLVPVRAVAEAFGCNVDWVQGEQKVMVLE